MEASYRDAWVSVPTSPATSTKTCTELCAEHSGSWCPSDLAFSQGSAKVCGESDNGLACTVGVSWAEADQICGSIGARLCSITELQTDETRSSGCGFDSKWVWSSHSCGSEHHVVARGARVHVPRCIATLCTGTADRSGQVRP